jgi:hypothetical protein
LCVKGVGDYPKEFFVGRRFGGKKYVSGELGSHLSTEKKERSRYKKLGAF